jgi:hypothetical protein
VNADGTDSLIAQSATLYNNTEHLAFSLPQSGDYRLRVQWSGERYDRDSTNTLQTYGLAWNATSAALGVIPEPGTLRLLCLLAPTFLLALYRHRVYSSHE